MIYELCILLNLCGPSECRGHITYIRFVCCSLMGCCSHHSNIPSVSNKGNVCMLYGLCYILLVSGNVAVVASWWRLNAISRCKIRWRSQLASTYQILDSYDRSRGSICGLNDAFMALWSRLNAIWWWFDKFAMLMWCVRTRIRRSESAALNKSGGCKQWCLPGGVWPMRWLANGNKYLTIQIWLSRMTNYWVTNKVELCLLF